MSPLSALLLTRRQRHTPRGTEHRAAVLILQSISDADPSSRRTPPRYMT
ncbi:hypothetical protein [Burkholderia sp. BDU5]|nr:hypothetical protein [Burkholderia sp. BDU5]